MVYQFTIALSNGSWNFKSDWYPRATAVEADEKRITNQLWEESTVANISIKEGQQSSSQKPPL